jgi:hypothetical protein
MKKWTIETALKRLGTKLGEKKVIIVDGTFTPGQCSAMDYLVSNHGYYARVAGRH